MLTYMWQKQPLQTLLVLKFAASNEEKLVQQERNTRDQEDLGKENDIFITINSERAYGVLVSENKEGKQEHIEKNYKKRWKQKTPDESYEASIGAKSDHINLEISEAKDGDGCHEKVSDSAVALIGTKSDCINLENFKGSNGDGFYEKVSHSAVGLI
ncbi:hypothetical protein HAX54_040699 [Datura stramonium]|uniref:Uncharacterized protein n=1 Tax=Datura stramonium TaxID=4076 RepID=A0ABS8VS22_DATST|nr:hypothetical protein [Datura stramonium]